MVVLSKEVKIVETDIYMLSPPSETVHAVLHH